MIKISKENEIENRKKRERKQKKQQRRSRKQRGGSLKKNQETFSKADKGANRDRDTQIAKVGTKEGTLLQTLQTSKGG